MQPRRTFQQRPRGPDEPSTLAGWLLASAETVLKISAVVLLASAGYLVFGITAGHLEPAADSAARAAAVFQTTSTVFTVGAILVAVATFVRFYDEPGWVYLAALPGALAFFGVPLLISNRYASPGPIGRDLVRDMQLGGEIIFMVVAIRAVIAIVERIRRPPEEPVERDRAALTVEKKKALTKPPIWAKCWELPYCHESLKAVCPAFEAGRSCWRVKRGCNCDPRMIDRLVEVRAAARGTTAQQQRTAKQYTREEFAEGAKAAGTKQLIACKKCPIYNEHQRQKFAIVNPVVLVATLAAMVLLAPAYRVAFGKALYGVDGLAARVSFHDPSADRPRTPEEEQMYHGPDWVPVKVEPLVQTKSVVPEEDMRTWLGQQLNDEVVRWISYIVICAFVLTYVLRTVEWAVLKAKW